MMPSSSNNETMSRNDSAAAAVGENDENDDDDRDDSGGGGGERVTAVAGEEDEKNKKDEKEVHLDGNGCDCEEKIYTCREVYEQMVLATSPSKGKLVRNFRRRVRIGRRRNGDSKNDSVDDDVVVVETELFCREALEAYSGYNLGLPEVSDETRQKYFTGRRGGSQGDYRQGMASKLANVVDCLSKFPRSKRAVVTIPNDSLAPHTSDEDAKCLRELHLYLDEKEEGGDAAAVDEDNGVVRGGGQQKPKKCYELNATVLMRAQAAEIFPKNVHFIATVMRYVADQLTSTTTSTTTSTATQQQQQVDTVVEAGELFYLATTLVSDRRS